MRKLFFFFAFTAGIFMSSCDNTSQARVKVISTMHDIIVKDNNLDMFKNGDTIVIERNVKSPQWFISNEPISEDTVIAYNDGFTDNYSIEYRIGIIVSKK